MFQKNWLELAQIGVIAAGVANTTIRPTLESALTVLFGIVWVAFSQWLDRDQVSQMSILKNTISEMQLELNQLATRVNDAKFLVNMKRGQ